jgi:hypothetical protein
MPLVHQSKNRPSENVERMATESLQNKIKNVLCFFTDNNNCKNRRIIMSTIILIELEKKFENLNMVN